MMLDEYKNILSEQDLKNLERLLNETMEKYMRYKSPRKLIELLVLIARSTRIPVLSIKSKSRKREVVEARHIYLALAKHLYPFISNREIAEVVDVAPSSVNAAKKTTSEVPSLREKYETIKNRIDGNKE